MAIVISALSVVVPFRTLEALWPGGERAYRAAVPNRTYRSDGHLTGVAFLSPADVGAWIEGPLAEHGMTYVRSGHAVDLVVVDQMQGPAASCPWIEFKRVGSWSEARLMGAPEVALIGPSGWSPEAEGVQFISPDAASGSLEFLEKRDQLAVFLDHRTGKKQYMGLTSRDGLAEILAGRLKLLEERLESLRPITDVDGPDKLTDEQRRAIEAVATEAGRMMSASPTNTSHALYLTGLALRMNGDFARAVTVWQAFTAREPEFHGGWMELTWCCSEAGVKDEALRAARRAVELAPDDAGAMSNLGGALLALDRRDEALAWIDRALLARPDDPITWHLKKKAEEERNP